MFKNRYAPWQSAPIRVHYSRSPDKIKENFFLFFPPSSNLQNTPFPQVLYPHCVLKPCLPDVYQFNPATHWRAVISRCTPFLRPFRVYQMSTMGTSECKTQLKIPKYLRISSLLSLCKGRHTALISLFYLILG